MSAPIKNAKVLFRTDLKTWFHQIRIESDDIEKGQLKQGILALNSLMCKRRLVLHQ